MTLDSLICGAPAWFSVNGGSERNLRGKGGMECLGFFLLMDTPSVVLGGGGIFLH